MLSFRVCVQVARPETGVKEKNIIELVDGSAHSFSEKLGSQYRRFLASFFLGSVVSQNLRSCENERLSRIAR